jgi:hypothetical protein
MRLARALLALLCPLAAAAQRPRPATVSVIAALVAENLQVRPV